MNMYSYWLLLKLPIHVQPKWWNGGQLEQVVYHLRFEVWKTSFTEEIAKIFFFLKQRHELDTSLVSLPANLNS